MFSTKLKRCTALFPILSLSSFLSTTAFSVINKLFCLFSCFSLVLCFLYFLSRDTVEQLNLLLTKQLNIKQQNIKHTITCLMSEMLFSTKHLTVLHVYMLVTFVYMVLILVCMLMISAPCYNILMSYLCCKLTWKEKYQCHSPLRNFRTQGYCTVSIEYCQHWSFYSLISSIIVTKKIIIVLVPSPDNETQYQKTKNINSLFALISTCFHAKMQSSQAISSHQVS